MVLFTELEQSMPTNKGKDKEESPPAIPWCPHTQVVTKGLNLTIDTPASPISLS